MCFASVPVMILKALLQAVYSRFIKRYNFLIKQSDIYSRMKLEFYSNFTWKQIMKYFLPALLLFLLMEIRLSANCGLDNLPVKGEDMLVSLRERYDLGLMGGPSSNMLRGNGFIRQYDSPILSFGSGLFFRYNFRKTFSLGTGFYYFKKGCYATATNDYSGVPEIGIQIRRGFTFFEVPLLLHVAFGRKCRYFIEAGGYASYLISQNDIFIPLYGKTYGEDNVGVYRGNDFGLIAGGGVQWSLRDQNTIGIGFRNEIGLTDLSRNYAFTGGATYTYSGLFYVSYVTHFGKRKTAQQVN